MLRAVELLYILLPRLRFIEMDGLRPMKTISGFLKNKLNGIMKKDSHYSRFTGINSCVHTKMDASICHPVSDSSESPDLRILPDRACSDRKRDFLLKPNQRLCATRWAFTLIFPVRLHHLAFHNAATRFGISATDNIFV